MILFGRIKTHFSPIFIYVTMKQTILFAAFGLLGVATMFAQQGVTQCGVPTGQPRFPVGSYQELPDPDRPQETEWAEVTSSFLSWGTTDERYAKHRVPQLKQHNSLSLTGWRGERVNAQAVLWTGRDLKKIRTCFSDFKDYPAGKISFRIKLLNVRQENLCG